MRHCGPDAVFVIYIYIYDNNMGQAMEPWLSCYLFFYQVTRQSQFHDLTHMYIYIYIWSYTHLCTIICLYNYGGNLVPAVPHYSDVTMSAMASQITVISTVCSTICSGSHQRKHQSSASLGFVWGIHQWPVDSPHKGPIMWKLFPFDHVILIIMQSSFSQIFTIDTP